MAPSASRSDVNRPSPRRAFPLPLDQAHAPDPGRWPSPLESGALGAGGRRGGFVLQSGQNHSHLANVFSCFHRRLPHMERTAGAGSGRQKRRTGSRAEQNPSSAKRRSAGSRFHRGDGMALFLRSFYRRRQNLGENSGSPHSNSFAPCFP